MQHWSKSFFPYRLGLLLAVLGLGILAAPAAYADSIEVTTNQDIVDANGGNCVGLAREHLGQGDDLVSLREALCAANTNPDPDTIVLPADTYLISLAGAGEDGNGVGDLDILEAGGDLTISGAGASTTIIDGNGSVIGDRVLDIPFDTVGYISVTISGVTLQHGSVPGGLGGGLYVNRGHTIRIQNSTIYSNTARAGGGIWTRNATLDIDASTLSDNRASEDGGGIHHDGGSGKVTINNSTLSGNQVVGSGDALGGGIYNAGGSMQITASTLFGNKTASTTLFSEGGAIYHADGTLNVTTSSLHDNSATGEGEMVVSGGAMSLDEGNVTISYSTISSNTALYTGVGGARGGGVFCSTATVTMTHSLVSENQAEGGGGGFFINFCTLAMTNTTVSGNLAEGNGGGISAHNTVVKLDHTTVTANVADSDGDDIGDGGGIVFARWPVELKNTIVAGNVDKSPTPAERYPDCRLEIVSRGNSLIGNQDGCSSTTWLASDQVGGDGSPTIDPLLHPLADNGGATKTHALRPGSPALDTATCTDIGGNTVADDQRSWSRPVGGKCDVGAYEAAPDLTIKKSVTPDSDVAFHSLVTYTIMLTNSSAAPAVGVNVSDLLPQKVTFARWAPSGQPSGAKVTNDVLSWYGPVSGGQVIHFAFVVTHTGGLGDVVTNTAEYNHTGSSGSARATFAVESGHVVYLPIVLKKYKP